MSNDHLVHVPVDQDKEFKRSQGRGWGLQCKANRHYDGARCTRWAIVGGYVCMKHGGQLPRVRAAATTRIRSLLPLALDVIETQMREGKPAHALKAARFVIRYSGITPQNVRSVEKEQRELMQATPKALGGVKTDAEIDSLITQLMLESGENDDSTLGLED